MNEHIESVIYKAYKRLYIIQILRRDGDSCGGLIEYMLYLNTIGYGVLLYYMAPHLALVPFQRVKASAKTSAEEYFTGILL